MIASPKRAPVDAVFVGALCAVRLAFHVQPVEFGFEYFVDRLVDLFFVLDVILNFFTARAYTVEKTTMLTMDRRSIVKHYMKFWLWMDLLSSFPFDVVLEIMHDQKDQNAARSAKAVRVFKLLKVGRALRLRKIIIMVQRVLMLSNAKVEIAQFMVCINLYCHFSSCAFFSLSSPTTPNTCMGWRFVPQSDVAVGEFLLPAHNSTQSEYLCATRHCTPNSWARADCVLAPIADEICYPQQCGTKPEVEGGFWSQYLAAYYWCA